MVLRGLEVLKSPVVEDWQQWEGSDGSRRSGALVHLGMEVQQLKGSRSTMRIWGYLLWQEKLAGDAHGQWG